MSKTGLSFSIQLLYAAFSAALQAHLGLRAYFKESEPLFK
jgi:hypothetical protein